MAVAKAENAVTSASNVTDYVMFSKVYNNQRNCDLRQRWFGPPARN